MGWILFGLFYLWIYEKDWTADAGTVLSVLVFAFVAGWGIVTYLSRLIRRFLAG